MITKTIDSVTLTEILSSEDIPYDFEKIEIVESHVFLTLCSCITFFAGDLSFFKSAFSKYGFDVVDISVDAQLVDNDACLVLSFFLYEKMC